MRTIASDIILVAVAILVPTLMLIPSTWKSFLVFWYGASREDWRAISLQTGIILSPPLLFAVSAWLSLTINTEAWFNEMFYVSILLLLLVCLIVYTFLVFVVFKWLWNKFQRRESSEQKTRPSVLVEVGLTSALFSFILAVSHLVFVMMTSIEVAIGVTIGFKDPRESFEYARAMIITGLGFFSCGLYYLAFSYCMELYYSARKLRDN